MQKVIALDEKEDRILTTKETATKNKWWITHNLIVEILPKDLISCVTSDEPFVDNIMKSNGRFYKIKSSEKVLICAVCQKKANHRIGYRFYCKPHWKHFTLTKPIRRMELKQNRNHPCNCGSGKKYKFCCQLKDIHGKRHYFNSPYMADEKIIKSIEKMNHN